MGWLKLIKELEDILLNKTLEDRDNLSEIDREKRLIDLKKEITPYDYVLLARHEKRPKPIDFIENIIDDRFFLKGDRLFKDDKSIIGGLGYLNGMPITFIGTNKGKTVKENIDFNFGMPNPEGYRKSLRLMKQAEKFNRPIITFIDTPGAYPGIEAEMRGQGEAIARNIMEMTNLNVPIIAVFTGEGGSGGALALAVADRIIMMEYSIYSILSPEGFSTILWKDSSKVEYASEIMKLTSKDLYKLKIIDRVVDEDLVFNLEDYKDNFERLKNILTDELNTLVGKNKKSLLKERYKKFRKIGGGI